MSLRYFLLTALPVVQGSRHLNFDFPDPSPEPVQFQIKVHEDIVEEAKYKASLYRPSIDLEDDVNWNWVEGPPAENQTQLAAYWADEFDWFKIQDELNNNQSHWAVTIDGVPGYQHSIPLHFSHEKSDKDGAIPLLLLHGWPSTHLEWHKIMEPLTSPDDDDTQAFHFIAPDLPGFGFSPAPTHSGMGPREMAHAFDALMKSLGYDQYGVISTDAGWYVAMVMMEDHADSIIGHFTDFFNVLPTDDDLARLSRNETSAEETAYITSQNEFFGVHGAYFQIQSLAPLLAAQALTDSPVGFGGWINHLYYPISDAYHYAYDELITNAMLLWIPGTYGHLRIYRETVIEHGFDFKKTDVPTGVTGWGFANTDHIFPKLASNHLVPPEWIERFANLVYRSIHDNGGHFPANNVPLEYAEEVQTFFGGLVKGVL